MTIKSAVKDGIKNDQTDSSSPVQHPNWSVLDQKNAGPQKLLLIIFLWEGELYFLNIDIPHNM